jgi:starch synthase
VTESRVSLKIADLDGDGEDEVILRNHRLYAVVSPLQGGRLIYLFARTPRGGALLVGNPTDDWNFQEELNRYMDQPSNHPGALADIGFEHDRYRISFVEVDSRALIEMANVQEGSQLFGTRKSMLLSSDASALVIGYRIPDAPDGLATDSCLSPDYYRLLRRGRHVLSPIAGERWRGYRNGDVSVWMSLAGDEETSWDELASHEVGHGFVVRVMARTSRFHLLLGYGETDDERCRRLIETSREAMHQGEELAGESAQIRNQEVPR